MGKKVAPAPKLNGTPSDAPPAWPSVARPLHSPALSIVELHPGLIHVDHFLLSSTLQLWMSFLTSASSPIKLSPSPPAKKGEAQRTNHRFSVNDSAFARELWTSSGLEELLVEQEDWKSFDGKLKPVGLNSNVRLYQYLPGAFFGPHYDDDFRDPTTGWRSEWTLLVYLTGEEDGVRGGGTAFYPDGKMRNPLVVPLRRGRAVLHHHGSSCMLHEGQKVDAGVKWVLRSDVMFA